MDGMEVYIHIPFCKRKCRYCDFASCAGRPEAMEPYARTLMKEIALRAAEYGPVPVATLYIGGGTPSLMPPALMQQIITCLFDHFPKQKDAEITCEMNPGTVTEAFLQALKGCGVNRLSLGAQARQGHLLQTLGRIHCWDEVEEAFRLAFQAGFENANIDLMFGLPGQTRKDWLETLESALSLHPRHLSCYGLILEEGTPLFDLVSSGALCVPEPEAERRMYGDALRVLKRAGFVQYEISNFALSGFACRHNLGYWQGASYLGFGAAAHSRMNCDPAKGAYHRFGNTPDLDEYIGSMENNILPVAESQFIAPREAEFETLMLGLRVLSGVEDADFLRRHGRTLWEAFGEKISPLVKRGLLRYAKGRLCLTRRGMDVQNAVLVELMDG